MKDRNGREKQDEDNSFKSVAVSRSVGGNECG